MTKTALQWYPPPPPPQILQPPGPLRVFRGLGCHGPLYVPPRRRGPLAPRTVRCSSRWLRSSSRPGSGREINPLREGRTSPSRRPGGPAPKRWKRRPRRPPVLRGLAAKPTASTGGDRGAVRENISQATAQGTFGPCDGGRNPNRERCRRGVLPWGSKGAEHPSPAPLYPQGVGGSPEARIKARNHVSSIGTARSATLAVRRHQSTSWGDSGKNGIDWRESGGLAGVRHPGSSRYRSASDRSSPVSSAKRTMSRRRLRPSFVFARAM